MAAVVSRFKFSVGLYKDTPVVLPLEFVLETKFDT